MKKLRFLILALAFAASVPMMAQSRQVVLETTLGKIVLTLYDDTPKHRDNFLKLTNEQFYDSLLFHRCIKNFMIQGGDPDSKHAEPGVTLGEGDNGYTIEAEFFDADGHLLHPHKRGAVAAAREGDNENPERRSSGCQFYIVYGKKQAPGDIKKVRAMLDEKDIQLTPQMSDDYQMRGGTPYLDGQYTVFGEVIEGMDVVKQIQAVATDKNDRPLEDVVVRKMTVEQYSKNKKK